MGPNFATKSLKISVVVEIQLRVGLRLIGTRNFKLWPVGSHSKTDGKFAEVVGIHWMLCKGYLSQEFVKICC